MKFVYALITTLFFLQQAPGLPVPSLQFPPDEAVRTGIAYERALPGLSKSPNRQKLATRDPAHSTNVQSSYTNDNERLMNSFHANDELDNRSAPSAFRKHIFRFQKFDLCCYKSKSKLILSQRNKVLQHTFYPASS
jgi:hypothetical protein